MKRIGEVPRVRDGALQHSFAHTNVLRGSGDADRLGEAFAGPPFEGRDGGVALR
jgi:hypothetical protein